MKNAVLFISLSGLGFLLMGYQVGLFDQAAPAPAEPDAGVLKASKGRFPEDLALAVRQQPIPHTQALDRSKKVHKTAILKASGVLHPYHEKLPEDWQAENIEETEVVVVIHREKKEFVDRMPYPPPAPPIDRYRHEMEAYIVDAHTGKVLAARRFINEPRSIQRTEWWDQTVIGQPVAYKTIYNWLAHQTLAGFPYEPNAAPIVTRSE